MSLKSAFPGGSHDIRIETPRLILREIELGDRKKLLEITNVPGFSHYCFDGSEEKVDDFLTKCLTNRKPNPKTSKRDYIMLAITDRVTGEFLGCTSLEQKTFIKGCDYEINFFVDVRKQSKGYGREGLMNLTDYAFDKMKQKALNVTIEPDNKNSLAVAYTQGYKAAGSVDIDTPCFGTRKYTVLRLDRKTYIESRKAYEKLFLPKALPAPKKKPTLPPPPKAA